MILIRKATALDEKQWNAYVNKHREHSPYHLFGWKDAIRAAYQHRSHYLIAEKSINDTEEIVGVFPLIVFSSPLGKPTLCALPFCDIGGILANNDEIYALLLNESKKIALNYQAKSIEVRESVINSTKKSITEKSITEKSITEKLTTEKVSMIMSLPSDAETLFSNFKSKLRSQIRKAEKNGLVYKLGSQQDLLDDFYQVFAHNMKALGSPVHSKQWFISLLEYYKSNMVISIIYKDDIPIGGGIVLIAGNKAAIPWASTKSEYNRLSPNMMLYWSLLKHLCDNNIETFDFGRSSFGEGTYKFKQQWGAEPMPLNWFIIDGIVGERIKHQSNNQSQLRSIVEQVWQKLPLPVTIFIGPKIRRYINL